MPIDAGRRLLITGGTHSGKSYVAGLIAERLIAAGYVLLILDTEGDHARLDVLPMAVTLSGEHVLADPTLSTRMKGRRVLTEIVDMTSLSTPLQQDLVAGLMPHVEAHRRHSGLPHLVMLDEAHLFLGNGSERAGLLSPDDGGWCLITYIPAALSAAALRQIDLAIVLPFGPSDQPDPNLVAVASIAGLEPRELANRLDSPSRNRAVLLDRYRPGEMGDLHPGKRATPHVRHRHKYVERIVDPHHAFRFCDHDGDSSGLVARSLDELDRELRRCSPATLRHHGARHDFSRWAIDVLRDGQLADALRHAECLTTSTEHHLERGRAALLDAIESRYLR